MCSQRCQTLPHPLYACLIIHQHLGLTYHVEEPNPQSRTEVMVLIKEVASCEDDGLDLGDALRKAHRAR